MERYSHQILKARTTKLWELVNRSLRVLQSFVPLHLFWFHDVIIINGSYLYPAFNNRQSAKQYSGELIIEEVQTQLRKDEQGSKDKKGNKAKQESEYKQRGEKIGVKGVNKLNELIESSDASDEPSVSSELDYLFMPII